MGQDVLEYHGNAARSGLFVTPALTWESAKNLHVDKRFTTAALAGPIYSQPLYWSSRDGTKKLLLVATEQNILYALDATTGDTVWQRSLGAPAGGNMHPCGNIDPLGVTGTPIIDGNSGTIYVAAVVGYKATKRAVHTVFGLSIEDGTVLPGWPVDIERSLKSVGKMFNSTLQNQRGALSILGETLYVPFGGHFGDCGDYRGWVVGISLRPDRSVRGWSTRGRGGGIWAPGGIASDGNSLYFATGNTIGVRQWSDGEAIISLGADLEFSAQPRNFFAPSNWLELDNLDMDLGSSNPVPISIANASPSKLLLAFGKDGKAYLLDREEPGGIGGALSVTKVASNNVSTAPSYFARDDHVFVAFRGNGIGCPDGTSGDLTVLRISAGSPPGVSVAWCATASGFGVPIVTTSDGSANPIVWIVGAEGDNRLHGYRGDTGAAVFSGGGPEEKMTGIRRSCTPIAAQGRIYVAADQHVYAFAP